MPPPPGYSTDLPPGYMSAEQRDKVKRKERFKRRIWMVVGFLILVAGVLGTVALTKESNEPETLADVDEGECFRGEELSDVEVVDCGDAHHGEVVAILPPTDPNAAFPGEDALRQQQQEPCALKIEEYLGGGRDLLATRQLEMYAVPPTEADWNDGSKDTYCYVGATDPATTVDGSIEGLGTSTTTTPTTAAPPP